MKKCTLCGEVKPLSDYSPNGPRPHARCKPCRSRAAIERQRVYADEHNARLRRWRKARPQISRAIAKRYYARNKAAKAAYIKRWRKENPELWGRIQSEWNAANKPRRRAQRAKRRALELRATVAWANAERMRAIYAEAERITVATGIKHEVDHIVPLNSPIVCGLHWEANLQVLPRAKNRAKRNNLVETIHV